MSLRREAELALCATQFLTRLPTPRLDRFEPDWTTRSARYFPLVGQLVGGVSGAVLLAAAQLWTGVLPALLAVGAGVLVTGAFHEDGLADTADGLGGGQTPEQRLAIMKDSRVGTYGLLALGFALAIKVAALAGLPPMKGALVLVAAHGLARAAAVVVMRATPYAPQGAGGKWKPVPQGVRWAEVLTALAIAAWPIVLLPLPAVGWGVLAGAALAVAVAGCARALIGGHTGDVLGAVEQVFELGFLLGAAAVLRP